MLMSEAIDASQNWAARGYNDLGKCVAAVAFYGDRFVWLDGTGSTWAKSWVPIADGDKEMLDTLNFVPFGPKSPEQIESEVMDALAGFEEEDFDLTADDEIV